MTAVAGTAPALVDPPEVVAGSYGARDAALRRGLVVADAAAVAAAFCVVLAAAQPRSASPWALAGMLAWPLLPHAYGLYAPEAKRFARGPLRELPDAAHASLVGALVLWLYAQVTPLTVPGMGTLLTFAAATAVGMLVLRTFVRRILRRLLGPERAVIAGDAAAVSALARRLGRHGEYGVELIGVLGPPGSGSDLVPVVGGPSGGDLASVAADHRIERLILAGPAGGALAERVRLAHRLGLKVDYLPEPFDAVGARVEVDDIEGVAVYSFPPPVMPPSSRCLKRVMDVAGAIVLLALAAPLMAAVAVAVKLDSPGPVLFRQERMGRDGRVFRICKYRTMCDGADHMKADLEHLNEAGDGFFKIADDPRITRVGKFLRRTSLDELPQLFNVVVGEMSVVGPRPLVLAEDEKIVGWDRRRLSLTPGMTGPWQILGSSRVPLNEMVKIDYLYAAGWSLWGDLKILLRTIPYVLARRGL
jgi:exopolysaccharide biosynthesis polyprenyl glycosylphosphotransferase